MKTLNRSYGILLILVAAVLGQNIRSSADMAGELKSVLPREDVDRIEKVNTVATEQGAHTIGWDPASRSLYVFCPQSAGAAVFEERP